MSLTIKKTPNKKQNGRKAAIYDRWLFTLGGGEQVAFAYAESLRDLGYQTTLLTHQEIDIEKAQKKMDVNLKNIEIKYLPLMSSEELSQFTEQYDVFINTSYLDYFANRSKMGILSVFFPGQIFLTPYEYIKRALVLPSFTRFFIYPSNFQGFSHDHYEKNLIYKWMSQRSSIVFNQDVGAFAITLYTSLLATSLIDQIIFSIENEVIKPNRVKINDQKNFVTYYFDIPHTANRKFEIRLPATIYAQKVALVRLTIFNIRYLIYNIFKHFFPTWEMRLHGGPGVTKLSDLLSYNQIITISEFCRFWIKKYWGLKSQILYPPVSTKNFSPAAHKKNWIVHVGRFFVTGHCKKQLDLVKVFRQLVDKHGAKGWELHFVGSVHDGQKHQEYFEQVKYYAQGYPVYFHLDAPFVELKQVLAESKIYWHATGLDEDESSNPILFEHFGITTVEAMSAGCVPVVYGGGGQKEIVTKGSGYQWQNRPQLLDFTSQLIHDHKLWQNMSKKAIDRSQYFSREEFKKRFAALLHEK